MVLRAAIVFLIKVFPIFFLTLLFWQYVGVSRFYHALIAGLLDLVYPPLDPAGITKGVTVEGGEFLVSILFMGKIHGLKIVAEDITSNTAMLVSLYLASPIRPRIRRFAKFLLVSLLILFAVHCLTVGATIQYAFMTSRAILGMHSYGPITTKLVDSYTYFYELIGMYLVVLALWFPYIVIRMAEQRKSGEQV